MKIKICGLKRLEDIQYVNCYLPDYAGFVFAKSKRQVSIEQAQLLKSHLDSRIRAVGVFVDEDRKQIVQLVRKKIIDVIQLHGHEDHVYIQKLKYDVDVPIIKAVQVVDESSLDISYDVDYYLLDNKVAGSGQSFDWSLIKQLDKPIFLAGGIGLENIEEAKQLDVYALDISSGVETDGIKDEMKIKKVIEGVRDER